MRSHAQLVDGARRRIASAALTGTGLRDLLRLRREVSMFPTAREITAASKDLREGYEFYVSVVSSPGMAASLETSAMLLALCRGAGVRSAMDLGSGFSSYVLRRWAAEADCEVVSVDDDEGWLTKTHDFLTKTGLTTEGLVLWPHIPPRTFDLVFHDLAKGTQREAAMPQAMHATSRFIVLDDAQHSGHRAAMVSGCKSHHLRLYSARALTLDQMNRYAMVGVR